MPDRRELAELSREVLRLQNGAMHVDLVRTSKGLVRVGSMSDVSKLMARFGLREKAVVVPDWDVSEAGDNRTGEEFVQWHAHIYGSHRRDYIGTTKNIHTLYRNLAAIFPYYFDPKMITIVRKRWMKQWIEKKPVKDSYETGPLKILFKHGNISVFDEGQEIYGGLDYRPSISAKDRVEEILETVPGDSIPRDHLEIKVVGSGNGFFETTSRDSKLSQPKRSTKY